MACLKPAGNFSYRSMPAHFLDSRSEPKKKINEKEFLSLARNRAQVSSKRVQVAKIESGPLCTKTKLVRKTFKIALEAILSLTISVSQRQLMEGNSEIKPSARIKAHTYP